MIYDCYICWKKRLTHSTEQKLSSWIISSLDLVYLDKNRGQEIKSNWKKIFSHEIKKLKVCKAEIIHLDWKNRNLKKPCMKKDYCTKWTTTLKLQDWNRSCATTFLIAECLYEERSTCSLNYLIFQALPGSHTLAEMDDYCLWYWCLKKFGWFWSMFLKSWPDLWLTNKTN